MVPYKVIQATQKLSLGLGRKLFDFPVNEIKKKISELANEIAELQTGVPYLFGIYPAFGDYLREITAGVQFVIDHSPPRDLGEKSESRKAETEKLLKKDPRFEKFFSGPILFGHIDDLKNDWKLDIDTCDIVFCRRVRSKNQQHFGVRGASEIKLEKFPCDESTATFGKNGSLNVWLKIVFFAAAQGPDFDPIVKERFLALQANSNESPALSKATNSPVVAIDFGNTNSTVAWYQNGYQTGTQGISIDSKQSVVNLVRAENGQLDPVKNRENISEPSAGKKPEKMLPLDPARMNALDGTGFSTWEKRIECPKRWIGTGKIENIKVANSPTGTATVEWNGLVPAEIRISERLQECHQRLGYYPEDSIFTYPTTYMRSELKRFQHTAVRALVRARATSDAVDEDQQKALSEAPHFQLIDEASASAFHFWAEQFFKSGKSPEFRYIYNDSLARLLIVDIGGGTTDVAIVECKLSPNSADKVAEMNVRPVARTGLRNFGGDDITIAWFKVIKAWIWKRASLKASIGQSTFSDWYTNNKPEIDKNFETTWEFDSITDKVIQRKAALLKFAEQVKISVSGENKIDLAAAQAINVELEEFNRDIKQLREFVNAMILPELERCCRRINHLLDIRTSRVNDGSKVIDHIDHFYLVGNASRYPFLKDYFVKHLQHLIFEPQFPGTFDKEFVFPNDPNQDVLKNAVVRGAILAKRFEQSMNQIEVTWDKSIADKSTIRLFTPDVAEKDSAEFMKIGENLNDKSGKWCFLTETASAKNYTLTMRRQFEGGHGKDDADDFVKFSFPAVGDSQSAQNDNVGIAQWKIHARVTYSTDALEPDKYELTWDQTISDGENRSAHTKKTAIGEIIATTDWLPPIRRHDL